LDTYYAFTGGVDGELTEIRGNPFAAQIFSNSSGCAGAAKEISDYVAFVGGGFENAFY
jgi:hypothetical protein